MEKELIYKYKACLQVKNLFFKNKTNFDDLNDDEAENLYFEIKEFLTYVYRLDKESYLEAMPNVFKEEQVDDINRLKEAFTEINNNANIYINFEKELNKELKEKINKEFTSKNFIGSFPKYYLVQEENTLVVEYDDDIYYKDNELNVKRNAVIVKIPNELVGSLNIDLNTFTHEDLVLKYNTELNERKIKAFLVHLPDLDYSSELTDKEIERDLKYFDIINSVLNGDKYLPKWYIEYNRTSKDFSKMYFMLALLIGLPTVLVLSILLNVKGLGIVLVILAYTVISYYITQIFGKKKYDKVHK